MYSMKNMTAIIFFVRHYYVQGGKGKLHHARRHKREMQMMKYKNQQCSEAFRRLLCAIARFSTHCENLAKILQHRSLHAISKLVQGRRGLAPSTRPSASVPFPFVLHAAPSPISLLRRPERISHIWSSSPDGKFDRQTHVDLLLLVYQECDSR